MAAKASLRLALLGGFVLSDGGREIAVAASGQRLIALLALRDRPLTRLYLAGTLWPEYRRERSLADLRTTLWRVNQSGHPIVVATHSCLGLGGYVDVDVHRLVAFTRRLNEPALRAEEVELDSVGLPELSGELLPDWYEDWLLVERERFRQLRLHALEAICYRLTNVGRYALALQAGLAAVACEPLRESAQRQVIRVHLKEGNATEALRQYWSYARLLANELGARPSPSMEQLLAGCDGQFAGCDRRPVRGLVSDRQREAVPRGQGG